MAKTIDDRVDVVENDILYIKLEQKEIRCENNSLKTSIDMLSNNISNLTDIVTKIQQRPADNWNKAIWIVISTVIGIAVGKFF